MDIKEREKELFYRNLLILGWDKAEIEKKYRLNSDKNMLAVSNQAMFEVVTVFLFSKLNKVSKKQYQLMNLPLDKAERRPFLKNVYNYLIEIKKVASIEFPSITLSGLTSCFGDRFYELYLAFSTHVVEQTLKFRNNVDYLYPPTVSDGNVDDVIQVLQISSMSSVDNFKKILEVSQKQLTSSFTAAKYFTEVYQKNTQNFAASRDKISHLESNLNILLKRNCSGDDSFDQKRAIKDCLDSLEKVQKYWDQLGSFLEKEKKSWEILEPVIDSSTSNSILEDTNLPKFSPEQLGRFGLVDCLNSQGKVSLKRCLENIIAVTENYFENIKMNDLSLIKKICPIGIDKADVVKSLNELKIVKENIETGILQDVGQSLAVMKETLFSEENIVTLKDSTDPSKWCFPSTSMCEAKQSGSSSPVDRSLFQTSLLLNDPFTTNKWDMKHTFPSMETVEQPEVIPETKVSVCHPIPPDEAEKINHSFVDANANIRFGRDTPENTRTTSVNLTKMPLSSDNSLLLEESIFSPTEAELIDFDLDVSIP